MSNDPLGDLFAALRTHHEALDALREEHRAAVRARRNSPEARAVRSQAAREGWAVRRVRETAERAAEYDDGPVRTGPRCDYMNHDSTGRETFCVLDPDHIQDPDEPHDDGNGVTWEHEDY